MMQQPVPHLGLIVHLTKSSMSGGDSVSELTVVAVLGSLTQALFWSAGE
jgi:hypothetical protein